MNFTIYAVIASLITLFFLISFIKQRRAFQLAFAIWVPSTMLQYVSTNRTFFNILSIAEIIMFVITIALLIKDQHDRKKAAARTAEEEEI